MFNNKIHFEREVRKIYQITSGSQVRNMLSSNDGSCLCKDLNLDLKLSVFLNGVV